MDFKAFKIVLNEMASDLVFRFLVVSFVPFDIIAVVANGKKCLTCVKKLLSESCLSRSYTKSQFSLNRR